MATYEIRYPDIEVELVGHDGNAYAIMGRVSEAMRRGGMPETEINQFKEECMSGDYDHLLQTCMRWVSVS